MARATGDIQIELSPRKIADMRSSQPSANHVMFQVTSLYGLSTKSVRLPLSKDEFVDSGQICLTADPEAGPSKNIGTIDYARSKLVVSYGAQIVFPGLYQTITSGNFDPMLLNPVRVVATDVCTLTPDRSGWHAEGCLDFLPGSIWSGATGG
ncbi:MAG: hypothetical protein IH872_02140 [Chloroflexi bacterium]|nr:hypothetical protein [Chloroflexota bacterium]